MSKLGGELHTPYREIPIVNQFIGKLIHLHVGQLDYFIKYVIAMFNKKILPTNKL